MAYKFYLFGLFACFKTQTENIQYDWSNCNMHLHLKLFLHIHNLLRLSSVDILSEPRADSRDSHKEKQNMPLLWDLPPAYLSHRQKVQETPQSFMLYDFRINAKGNKSIQYNRQFSTPLMFSWYRFWTHLSQGTRSTAIRHKTTIQSNF